MASPNKTRVQVATDPAFSNVVHDVEGAYTTALQIAQDILPRGINLYARGMHGHPTTGDSSWSTTVQFQIKLAWSDWDGSANGLEYSLNSSVSTFMTNVSLSDTTALICYSNVSDNAYLYAILVNINGGIITSSTPVQCNSIKSQNISIVVLSTNKVMVCYSGGDNNDALYAIILSVTNSDIIVNSPIKCNNDTTWFISAVALSDTSVLVSYRNYLYGYMYGLVLVVDGTSIIVGTPVITRNTDIRDISSTILLSNKVLVCYQDFNQNNHLCAILLTVSGYSITVGSPVSCNSTNTTQIECLALSSTKALVCYKNETDERIYILGLDINGSVITTSSPKLCNINRSTDISIMTLPDDRVMVNYRNIDDSESLYTIILTLTTSIEDVIIGLPVKCNTSTTWYISSNLIDEKVFVTYNKGLNTTLYGKVLVDN